MSNLPSNDNPIQQHVEIDDMLLSIAAVDDQIANYKTLLAHRVEPIKAEIEKLEDMKEQYRSSIQQYMSDHDEKTLNYPGVGKVARRSAKGKWIIDDEPKLLAFLLEHLSSDELDSVVIQEPKLVKGELNKVLDRLSHVGELLTDAVHFERQPDSIAISFDKTSPLLGSRVKDRKDLLSSQDSHQPSPSQALPVAAAPAAQTPFDELDI